MANDFLSGLGGLVKGLSGFMPQDDPAVQMLNSQTQVNDLKKQEADIYAEIGKAAVEKQGLASFASLANASASSKQTLRQRKDN